MKVQLNVITSFNGVSLKPGNEIDVPLNVAQRWFSRGIAHPVKAEPKPAPVKVKKSIKVKEAVTKPKKTKKIKEEEPIEEVKQIEEVEEIADSNTQETYQL